MVANADSVVRMRSVLMNRTTGFVSFRGLMEYSNFVLRVIFFLSS